MRWEDVKEQLPEAKVLARDTGYPGYRTRYGVNPYRGYDRQEAPPKGLFSGAADDALPQMERVVALHEEGESWAVPFSTLRDEGMAQLELAGRQVVVFFQPRTVSSVSGRRIMDGREVGSSAVYETAVDGRSLTFRTTDQPAIYRDAETGSFWNFAGQAVDGPLEGTQLDEVVHGNHFWFAWGVFRPETRIWEP